MTTKKNPKLHEILAVENTVKTKLTKVFEETLSVFKGKQNHFDGSTKTYEPALEDGEKLPTDRKEMITTVTKKLDHLTKFIAEAMAVTIQKEETNCSGRANTELIVGDHNFGKFSATSLLAMEHSFNNLRGLMLAIPTLDMAKAWFPTDGAIYKQDPQMKDAMSQSDDFVVTVQATQHFPAQVNKVVKKFKIGTYTTTETSGRWTPTQKSEAIERLDKMLQGVKSARARANSVELEKVNSPLMMIEFIMKG